MTLWFFKDKYYAPKSSQKCVFGLMNFGHYKHQSRLLTNEYQQQLVSRSNPDIQYSITQTTTTLSRGILKPKWWLKSVSTLDSRKKSNWQKWKWIKKIRRQVPLKCKNVQFARNLFLGLTLGMYDSHSSHLRQIE